MPSPQLTCPACSCANPASARFCAGCGVSLLPSCPSCGAELLAAARYCNACGTAVGAADGGAGRKVVTALFADLAGSTALQETLDPESARAVMGLFYEHTRAVIEQHEGRVEKFIGDAIVAIFGAPVVREDDALRAVRAAAAMGPALERLNELLQRDWGVRLQLRMGVNTGELVLGARPGDSAADGGEIVVGDIMNTAARLEQAASDGEVLIGEETRRLVRHAVELEAVSALELKGKSQPVRAWRLVSVEPPSGDEEIVSQTPLVGRESQLARLRAALQSAISERACRLVTVVGSPGVGKTRLALELAHAAADQARVVEGRCEPSGEGITLLPVAEVLRSLADVGEADPGELVREKLGALVAEDPDRERLIGPLAGVLGIAAGASAQETFWALRRCLEQLARHRPIVIVLDDLHWGQPMFLDLVEHLIEWVSDAPVLLLALARPELREVREALTSPRRASEVIELAPLDERQSEALVSGLLGGVRLPSELAQRILASSEGNPLFLGEMLRMLIDEGTLEREGDAWVTHGKLDSVDVPPTIHALLSARIERLDSDERSVVERAAVIGKEFYRGAVAELVAPPVKPRIDGHLEALRRKDMVEPDGTYWIDEPVYRFHHVLIRDAAYRSLLKEARAELHERFADWLQEKAGELVGEHEEVIAFHLEQAHAYRRELGPLDQRGRSLGIRAAQRLHSAGQRALAREDLAAAANLLTRALECDTRSEREILWDLCEALLSAGDTAQATGFVERFAMLASDDQVGRNRARVLEAQLANLSGSEGGARADDGVAHGAATAGDEVAVSAEAVEAAARTLAELGDARGEAKAWQVAAGTHAALGQVGAAEEALDRALAAARAADDQRRITAVLTGAPRAALWGPSPVVRASGRCLDVVRILRMSPGNRHVEAIALRCQAVLEAMRSRADAAREILAAGRATLQELGLTLELQESAAHTGIVELLAGDPRAAVDHLRGARDGFQSLGVASGAAQSAALLARALVELGDHDEEAIEQTRFAERHGGEDLKTTITWCSARAHALARAGDVDEALSLAERAVALARPTDALADKADVSMALAQVLLAAGHEEQAHEAARAARELYEAKGHTVGMERAANLTRAGGGSGAGGGLLVATPSGPPVGEPVPAAAAGQAVFGDRAPERFFASLQQVCNAREYERMPGLIAQDWEWADHRALGWERAHGREQLMAIMRSTFSASPDLRMDYDEVVACDERVIAVRMAFRGRGIKAGELEVEFGAVMVVEAGQWRSVDFYEATERDAMLARYVELGGGHGPLGERLPERIAAELISGYLKCWAAKDVEGLLEHWAENAVLVDHRALGWETIRGREEVAKVLRAFIAASPNVRLEIDEMLACDDRVSALRMTYRGVGVKAGELEYPLGCVFVIEDKRIVSQDMYEAEDREAMLARYAELTSGPRSNSTGGGRWELPVGHVSAVEDGLLVSTGRYEWEDTAGMLARHAELGGRVGTSEERAPERFLAEFKRRHAARDLDGLVELYAEDWVMVDHRALGWEEIRGRAAAAEALRAYFAFVTSRRTPRAGGGAGVRRSGHSGLRELPGARGQGGRARIHGRRGARRREWPLGQLRRIRARGSPGHDRSLRGARRWPGRPRRQRA